MSLFDPFSTLDLIDVLQECERQWPLSTLLRSREGTGNICVYDGDEYVAVIMLRNPPELVIVPDE